MVFPEESPVDGGEDKRQGKKGRKRARPDSRQGNNGNRKDYPAEARESKELIGYYEEQKIVADRAELNKMFATMREPLPTAFRIMSSSKEAAAVKYELEQQFQPLFAKKAELLENPGQGLKMLSWYPDGLGWSVATPRKVLRKDEALSSFHKFLIAQNAVGAVNRQEAVSMIPPLLLDMKPGLRAIDLCAAPGSKTAQLLDMLQSGVEGLSSGLVVANDVDIKRCWMLTHQLKRFSRPDLVITAHEAQHFPGHPGLKFDRVLCDVPCSGDGTLRKAPDLWYKWTPHTGMGLHRLQVAIATRGFQLLVPGGRMVYSTCSMNPVENEAVVNVLLDRFGDEIEVVDVSNELPQLIRRPGLIYWRVRDFGDSKPGDNTSEQMKFFESYEKVPPRRRKVVPGQFPPENPSDHRVAALKRCLRVLPHDQDTGAFFVAVLNKKDRVMKEVEAPLVDGSSTADITEKKHKGTEADDEIGMPNETSKIESKGSPPAERKDDSTANKSEANRTTDKPIEEPVLNKDDDKAQASTEHSPISGMDDKEVLAEVTKDSRQPQMKKRKRGDPITQQMDEPLELLSVQNPEALVKIVNFFSLDRAQAAAHLMTRSAKGETPRKVYFLSPASRQTVEYNKIRLTNRGGLRVVFAGVRVMELTTREGQSSHRLASEGLSLMVPLMTGPSPRIIQFDREDFRKMALSDGAVLHNDFEGKEGSAQLESMSVGACVVQLLIEGKVLETVGAWRGSKSLGISQAKEDLKELRGRLEAK